MSNYEARIQTRFGTLTINFNNSEEFVQRLQSLDLETITNAIQEHLSEIIISEPRRIKPALVEICGFTPDGGLEFFKPPKGKVDAIGVVLYAFDPVPVETSTIEKLAAVSRPGRYFGQKQYKKYFENVGHGLYRLSHEGKLWVTNSVIPKVSEGIEKEE